MRQQSVFNPKVLTIITMVCPALLLIMLFIGASAITDYYLARSLISELSIGRFSWFGAAFFILSAITVLAFAGAISAVIPLNKWPKIIPALLSSTAVFLLLLSIVGIDHVHGIWTIKRAIHWSIACAAAGCFIVSCFLITDSLKENAQWKRFSAFSSIMAVITVAIGVGLAIVIHSGFIALLERLFFVSAAIWVEVASARAYWLSRKGWKI